MKIKQITTLLLFTFLSLPLAAQVYLDSAEVARFLPYKNKVVTTTQNALEQDSISSDDETDDEVDSTLTAFDYDTHLHGKKILPNDSTISFKVHCYKQFRLA